MKVLLAVLVVCTAMLALGRGEDGEPLAHPHGDAIYYYVYAPSLLLDFDVDLDNQYAVTHNPWDLRRTPTGHAGNVFGVGPALYASPLFLVGHGIALIAGERDDGFSAIERFCVCWASVLASVAAIWFAYRLLARRLGAGAPIDRRALAAAIATFAGGPVLFYAVRQPCMAHPFATLFTAWLVDAWDASYDRERTLRTWATLGALYGAAVLARPQLATWGICLAAAAVSDLRRLRVRALPRLAVGAAAALAAMAPQLVTWKLNYGSFFVVPQGDGFMRWDAICWSEVLFSSRNGLLPWTPLYAVGLVGLCIAARKHRRLAGILLAGIGLQVLVNGAAWDWWAGGSFGARRFDSAYIAFAFGVGFVLVAVRHRIARWAVAIAIGWLVLANVILTLKTTPQSMRQKGGESASSVIADQLGVFGMPVGWLSSLTNLPARAAFALRHGTGLSAYDHVVGVHWLAETYPGLSTRTLRSVDHRRVVDIPYKDGFDGDVLDGTSPGRILIGLNRRGPIHVEVAASAPVTATWNGAEIAATAPINATWTGTAVVDQVEPLRGINTLELHGPPGTHVFSVELRGEPDEGWR